MGVDISFLSLPENCQLMEAAKTNEAQALWVCWIPEFLADLEGLPLDVLGGDAPPNEGAPHLRLKRYWAPYFKPFRQIWPQYIALCEANPGLEKRYCETSKDWERMSWLLPDDEIEIHGSMWQLSSKTVNGSEPLSVDHTYSYHPPEVVFEIAVYLNHITIEQLAESYRELWAEHEWTVYDDQRLHIQVEHFIKTSAVL